MYNYGLRLLQYIYMDQGRIQDLWLGGAWVGEGCGDRLRSPAGPGQNPGREPRGAKPPEALRILGITDNYLNDNFEPTTPFLSNQKNLILSLNFVG
jgi:hypothetical protein